MCKIGQFRSRMQFLLLYITFMQTVIKYTWHRWWPLSPIADKADWMSPIHGSSPGVVNLLRHDLNPINITSKGLVYSYCRLSRSLALRPRFSINPLNDDIAKWFAKRINKTSSHRCCRKSPWRPISLIDYEFMYFEIWCIVAWEGLTNRTCSTFYKFVMLSRICIVLALRSNSSHVRILTTETHYSTIESPSHHFSPSNTKCMGWDASSDYQF